MALLRRLLRQFWHLFVEEPVLVAILLAWIAIACLALSWLGLGSWSGPILFAGIAVITFGGLRPPDNNGGGS